VAVYAAAIVSFLVDVIFGCTAVEVAGVFSVVDDKIVIFSCAFVGDVCVSVIGEIADVIFGCIIAVVEMLVAVVGVAGVDV